jgi:hypothetical protein
MDALAELGIANSFASVLDHGGDRGQMLSDICSSRRAVYDISGVNAEVGVESIGYQAMIDTQWNLILSCHVLEHLPDPHRALDEIVAIGKTGTVFYIEVPNEQYHSISASGSDIQRMWLNRLVRFPRPLQLFQFASTLVRAKIGITFPPFFATMHEHINFFSVDGLSRLAQRSGLRVLSCGVRATGHLALVAVRD